MQDKTPNVGFISLGCPKALVDSEQIITQLRAEGYNISPNYEQADLPDTLILAVDKCYQCWFMVCYEKTMYIALF